jgi:hypothetical protein
MTDNRGIFGFFGDIVDAFFEEFDKSLAQNLYGENGILDESDIDLQRIFRLFKEPEKLQAEFIEYNKKAFRQNFTDPAEFINAYFKASTYAQLHQKDFKMKQFVYLFDSCSFGRTSPMGRSWGRYSNTRLLQSCWYSM